MIRDAEDGENPVLYIPALRTMPIRSHKLYGSPQRVCQAVGVADMAELAQRIDRAVRDAGRPATVNSEPEGYRIIRKPDCCNSS